MKGRPVKSQIRQNVIEILHYLGRGYGYQIAKIYNEIFPEVTQRSVYYHLRKGVLIGEISVHKVEQEKGDFSWGQMVEKKYYSLGGKADPKGVKRVKEFLGKFRE
jgi:DNA-binding transcriptional ArsR family regulator